MKTFLLFNAENAGVLSLVREFELKNLGKGIPSQSQTERAYPRFVLINLLVFASFCYLLFPVIIFIFGFIRIEISVVLIGLICYVFYCVLRKSILSTNFKIYLKSMASEWRLWRGHFALLGLLALAWLSFSSIGGIGYRNFDSGIRSSLLWHLVTGSWPLYFEAGYFGDEFRMTSDKAYVYYFAYYLPAAVVGKLLGWKAANLALFAYSWLGASLALMLVRMYVQGRGYLVTAMVFTGICMFGGMDYVCNRLLELTADRSEMWLSPLHYFSHTRNLFWAPQHCLPTWLMIGIILNRRQIGSFLIGIFPLMVVCMLLWSPLCLIGLVPFLLTIVKYYWKEWIRLSLVNILTCFVFILLAAFIVSNDFSFRMIYAPDAVAEFRIKYSLFVLTEFLMLSFVFILSDRKLLKSNILIIAFVSLFTIPIFILGNWNDWSIKLSMAPLFVLSIFVIKQIIWLIENKRKAAYISVLLFGTCALTPLEELIYSAKNYRISFETPPEIREFGPNYIVWQQLGDPGSLFFRYLARR